MKKYILLLLISITLFASCRKDDPSFSPKFQSIKGIWSLEAVSYDSSGIRVTIQSKDKLRIEDDLSYYLYIKQTDLVENGTINIIDQTDTRLEFSFLADYPVYSSYAGSHVFSFFNLELMTLSQHEMILKTVGTEKYGIPEKEFYFTR